MAPNDYSSLLKYAPKADSGPGASGLSPDGSSQITAIPESPLSLFERAQLGWCRTAQEQQKLLRSKYDDVALTPTEDGGAAFVVKDKDGKWYQTDPAFHWSQSAAGINVPEWDNHNFKGLAGNIAQDFGEYGLRASAAMAAGGAAMTATGSATAPLAATGPVGAIGAGIITAGAGLAAAAAGAMSAEGVDIASRKLLMDPNAAGAGIAPKNADELQSQLALSALYGMKTFAYGKALELGGATAAKQFGKVLSTLTDDPEGIMTARKLLKMAGADDRLVDARLANPMRTARYDELASMMPANTLEKSPIDHAEDAAFDKIDSAMQGVLRRAQGEFSSLERSPGVQGISIDASQAVNDSLEGLKSGRLLLDNCEANPNAVMGDGDSKALKYLQGLTSRASELDYGDARAEIKNIGNLFNNGVSHPELRLALQNLKGNLSSSIMDALPEDAANQYAALTQKYGSIRSLADEMAGLSDSNRKLRFGARVLSQNRNEASELMSGLYKAGVPADDLQNFMQVQAAKASSTWLQPGKKLIGIFPKPNPELFSQMAGGARNAAQSLPYADQTIKFLKGLTDAQFKAVMTNPELFDQVAGMAGGALANERQTTDQLLQGVQ